MWIRGAWDVRGVPIKETCHEGRFSELEAINVRKKNRFTPLDLTSKGCTSNRF